MKYLKVFKQVNEMKRKAIMVLTLLFTFLLLVQVKAVVIADFETSETTPAISADGGVYNIVENPDKSGIDTSNTVGYYFKADTNWQYFTMTFETPVNIGFNNTLTFKVHASSEGRIFAKFWNDGEVLIENWAPDWNFKPDTGEWVLCTMDLTPAMNQEFDVLQIAACVDNEIEEGSGTYYEAEVYLDDFELSNPEAGDGSPFVFFSADKSKIENGDSITFDASESYDFDGEIVSYDWDFGDGETDTGVVVTHRFDSADVFEVKLLVTDNDDKTSSEQLYVFVIKAGEKYTPLKFVNETPLTNEKVEAIFQLSEDYENVFNPDEVKIDAEITMPDDSKIIMPCFYYVKGKYTKTDWLPDSSFQSWMLRFSSPQTGDHKVLISIEDKDGTTTMDEYTINIQQGEKRGIIKNDEQNPQYYRHETGEPFYPLGINTGWGSTEYLTDIFGSLATGGANLVRYWQTPFANQALEWSENRSYYKGHGLGVYSQGAAAMTDSLLNFLAANDMNMQLVIFQHGMFSENVNEMWEDNPYNSINGGFIDRAEEYFYTDTCKVYAKRLLRYIIARWAYSPNIFAWEFFNEVQFTGIHNSQTSAWYPGVLQWHDEMSTYIESIDPFNHIMTTSAEHDQLADFDTINNLDVLQYHLYSDNLLEQQANLDAQFLEELKNTSIINGEYGTNNDAETPFDMQRNAIWNSITSRVPHLMWIWDHYSESEWANLFSMPSDFLADEDFAAQVAIIPYNFQTISSDDKTFISSGITDSVNYYGYVYEKANSQSIDNATSYLSPIPYANYSVTYYLPVEETTIEIDSIALIKLENKLVLPQFSNGIAFKIKFLSDYTLPIAIAGRDTTVSPGEELLFSGELSMNPSAKPLSYTWTLAEKPSGSSITINNPNATNISLTPDVSGIYKLSLTVYDDTDTSVPDTVTITVSSQPIADAGPDQVVPLNTSFATLDGSGSKDADGDELTYLWTILSSPEGSENRIYNYQQVEASLRTDEIGEYLVQLIVNDGISDSEPDTVKITKTDDTPVDQIISENDLYVYPNPASDKIYLSIPATVGSTIIVELINIVGKKVISGRMISTGNDVLFNLNGYNLNSGIYLLRIQVDDQQYIRKIYIERK